MSKENIKQTISDGQLRDELIKLFESVNIKNYHLFKNNNPLRYYLYGLYDVLNEKIFYVGKGKGKRAWKHSKLDGSNKIKNNYISTLISKKANHEVIIFEDNLIEEDCLKKEAILIKEKYGELTNVKIESKHLSLYDMMCAKYGKDNVIIEEVPKQQIEHIGVCDLSKIATEYKHILSHGEFIGAIIRHGGKSYNVDNIKRIIEYAK